MFNQGENIAMKWNFFSFKKYVTKTFFIVLIKTTLKKIQNIEYLLVFSIYSNKNAHNQKRGRY